MKKETKWTGYWLLLVTTALSLLGSCMVDEYTEDVPPLTTGSGDVEVEFTMLVPGSMYSATKTALTEEQEKEVKTIELLVFEPGGDGNYRYTVFADMEEATYENGEIQFKVKLTEGLSDIVVLANSRNLILQSNRVTADNEKSKVLASLIQEESSDGKWIDTSYRPIPMSGYMGEVEVKENGSLPKVTLIRMLARINITLTSGANDTLKLSDVYLYNPYTKGYVAPDMDKLVKEGEDKYKKVNAPSVEGLVKRGNDDPVYYPILSYPDNLEDKQEFTNMIYTFEAGKGVDPEEEGSEMLNNTILVLGGYYLDNTRKTYYRVDFHNSKDGLGYLPLLRNHSYEVGIEKVLGPGLASPDEALKSKPMNITASVKGWDDSEMEDVFFDGQYYLTRNKGEFTLYREAYIDDPAEEAENILTLKTDYPGGWQIDSITWQGGSKTETVNRQNGWLDASRWSGKGDDTKYEIYLLLDANNTPDNRYAYLHVSAGRMTFDVKVTQTNQANLSLSVTDMYDSPISELVFGSGVMAAILPQRFQVRWAPKERNLTISNYTQGIGADDIFHFTTGSITPSDEFTGGSEEFLIEPPAMTDIELEENPFLERETRIEFMAANDDSRMFQSISLRQINYAIVPEDTQLAYMLEETHTIRIRSNTSWYVAGVEDEGNILAAGEKERIERLSGGYNKTTGDPISFSLNPEGNGQTAYITLRNLYGLCEDVVLPIRATSNHPNTYMIKPGESLSFHLRKPYEIWREYLSTNLADLGTGWSAEILWTDVPDLITSLTLTGESKGSDARINLTASGDEGNALIALTHNGEVYWTWLIWVTNYDPDETTPPFTYSVNQVAHTIYMMDRYLGARSNQPNDYLDNLGLVYQWGAPRPHPPLAEQNVNPRVQNQEEHRTLYEGGIAGEATQQYYNSIMVEPDAFNLKNYLMNPKTVYGRNHWYSTPVNYYLWCDESGNKGVFDPCPLGWRLPDNNDWFNAAQVVNWGSDGIQLNPELGYFPHTAMMTGSALSSGSNSRWKLIWSRWYGTRAWTSNRNTYPEFYFLGATYEDDTNKTNKKVDSYSIEYAGFPVRCIKE